MVWLVARLLGRGAAPRGTTVTRFAPQLEVLTDRTLPSANPIADVSQFGVPRPIGEEIPSVRGVGYETMITRGIGEEIPQGR